jgi:hypothetical protein
MGEGRKGKKALGNHEAFLLKIFPTSATPSLYIMTVVVGFPFQIELNPTHCLYHIRRLVLHLPR